MALTVKHMEGDCLGKIIQTFPILSASVACFINKENLCQTTFLVSGCFSSLNVFCVTKTIPVCVETFCLGRKRF